ncbi:MAG: 4-hydroxy-3-methylbut-2-en-1-yl diphosphate synthase [Muribaculaceae bacterium]|nr:4-hydroxy-3-methylbut-2-en-1-yl diphosphate synthase [Muribaculaceae bacterium]
MDEFNYQRRTTTSVNIGGVPLGSDYPIRVQSMTSTSTDDIEASVAQCKRICDAGADYVRLTAQGVKEAESIGVIRQRLRADGYTAPLVADIHFNPKAAFAAAKVTDKVRINPGNFVDVARTFKKLTYTDEEYAKELQKIHDALVPFIAVCREHGTAVRLGVNHGSLSDRIMSRYGNTPVGMVESVMEFLRVFVEEKFMDVVISMKASNTVVMVESVRRLIKAMDDENMHFPLHLGVTEAGDGEDGRIKSAVGIGTLLADGIGDTIRVSLSEEPEVELPVARKLVEYITSRAGHKPIRGKVSKGYNPVQPERRSTEAVGMIGGNKLPIIIASCAPSDIKGGLHPDFYFCADGKVEEDGFNFIVPSEQYKGRKNTSPLFSMSESADLSACNAPLKWLKVPADTPISQLEFLKDDKTTVIVVEAANVNVTGSQQAFLHGLIDAGISVPTVILNNYADSDKEWIEVKAGADFGTLLLNGFRDGIWLEAPNLSNIDDVVRYEFGILQAARLRMSKTEFISCPSCGRTLFDLQATVHQVKIATSHLTHLKIGIMGCIVNGPGEMADADYGYVGAAAGKVSLYKNKICVERNISADEAIPHLISLIKANGDWIDPK